jgi:hypothetical protein
MDDLAELEAYLSHGSYAKVARQFKIQNSTAQSRIRRQALTVMAATHYLKHDPSWEEQYTYLIWRVIDHQELFTKLVTDYKQLFDNPAAPPFAFRRPFPGFPDSSRI